MRTQELSEVQRELERETAQHWHTFLSELKETFGEIFRLLPKRDSVSRRNARECASGLRTQFELGVAHDARVKLLLADDNLFVCPHCKVRSDDWLELKHRDTCPVRPMRRLLARVQTLVVESTDDYRNGDPSLAFGDDLPAPRQRPAMSGKTGRRTPAGVGVGYAP